MKNLALVLLLVMLTVSIAWADQYVNGYVRKDGTAVEGYYRSSPNSSYNDNWSVKGNTNPYSGKEGTLAPTYNDKSPTYNEKTPTYNNYPSYR